MKLHSPEFERGLKREIKATIKRSPELRREFKRVKSYRKKINLIWLWRLTISYVVAVGAWVIQQKTGHLATALAGVSIYLLAGLSFRIQSLDRNLRHSPDLWALTILPVTAGTIFRWLFQKFIRESLYLLADLLIIFGALAIANGFAWWKWPCLILFAVMAWLNVMLLAIYGALRLPRWLFAGISTSFYGLAIFIFLGRSLVGPYALRLLDAWGLGLSLLLPSGWAVAPFELLNQSPHWWLLGFWLPPVIMLFDLKNWLSALRERTTYQEFVLPLVADLVPGEDLQADADAEKGGRLGPTAIEEIVEEATYLNQPGFALRHPPEKILWNWLTAREKALAEFIHPNGMPIWITWRKLYTILLATVVLVIIGTQLGHNTSLTLLVIGVFVVFCMGLAILANHGRTFAPQGFGGLKVPMYAGYGIGFQELGRFFTKYSLVQMPFLLVAFAILGGLTTWCLRSPIELGMLYGIKAAGLLLGLRFILLVFAFSAGTNDTAGFRLRAVALLICMLVLGSIFVGLGAAGVFVPDGVESFLLWAGALLDAWVFYWVYGWFYRFSRFDLIAVPRQ